MQKYFVLLLLLGLAYAGGPKTTTTAPPPTTTAPPPPPPTASGIPGQYSLFGGVIPSWAVENPYAGDCIDWTLAVRIFSNTTGSVTHIRFLTSPNDIGATPTGKLYSDSGVLLATGTFPTTDGTVKFIDAQLNTPVLLTPYTGYRAAVTCASGHKVNSDENGLYGGVNTQFLGAYPETVSPGNGLYCSGANCFPNTNFGANAYVDVIFQI